MKISVALCTYNGARFILEQLKSISAQTQVPHEVIVCDDGSTDGTLDIVARFAIKAPFQLQYSKNPTRLGVLKNFERAIGTCTGDVIFLCDQDDVWLPQKVATMSLAFLTDERVGLVFSNAFVTDFQLNRLGYTVWDTFGLSKKVQRQLSSDESLSYLIRRNAITGATAAFRATLRGKALPVPNGWMHDAWIAIVAASQSQLMPIDIPLMFYRQHEANTIGGRRLNLRNRLDRARTRSSQRYEAEISRLTELYTRLQAARNAKVDAHHFREIIDRMDHLNVRNATLSCSLAHRFRLVLSELITFRYFRFSNGFSSALVDLIL